MPDDVQLSDIQAAAARISGIAHRTPVLTSRSFDALAGASVFFKCENFQRGGAFKIRGATNLIFSIPKDQLHRGVVAFSSGNHAQAVAIAAASVGTAATIVMPDRRAQIETGGHARLRRENHLLRSQQAG